MTRPARLALQIGLSVVLIAAVLWQADLHKIGNALRESSPGWFCAAIAINIVATFVMVVRWHLLLVARGRREPGLLVALRELRDRAAARADPADRGGRRRRARDRPRAAHRRCAPRPSRPSSWIASSASRHSARWRPAGRSRAAPASGAAPRSRSASAWSPPRRWPPWRCSRSGCSRCCAGCAPLAARLRAEGPLRALYRALHAYRGHPATLAWVFVLGVLAQGLRAVSIGFLAHGHGPRSQLRDAARALSGALPRHGRARLAERNRPARGHVRRRPRREPECRARTHSRSGWRISRSASITGALGGLALLRRSLLPGHGRTGGSRPVT